MEERGRPRIAPGTPEELWAAFEAYKKKCEDDSTVDIRSGIVIPSPMTWPGFMEHLGVGYRSNDFKNYYKTKEGFSVVITRIENSIEANQLKGGLLGQYNPNLTARLNGYTEKTENKHEVNGGFIWKEIE